LIVCDRHGFYLSKILDSKSAYGRFWFCKENIRTLVDTKMFGTQRNYKERKI
jgi:hypothetical protein